MKNRTPELYHAHHNRYLEDLHFWLELAERYADPILELGCGTGRVLQPLLKAGYQAIGLDNDFAMLSYLHNFASEEIKTQIKVFQSDLTQFCLAIRFKLILLPCNTFSTLTPFQRRSALELVKTHLAPGGAFAFSIPNPEFLLSLPEQADPEVEDTFLLPLTGESIQVSSAWLRTRRCFIFTWHYDILSSDGQVDRITLNIEHTLTSPLKYLEEIQAVGLRIVDMWGDFDGSPYTSDSPFLLLCAGL